MASSQTINDLVNNYKIAQENVSFIECKETQICKQQLLIQENENESVLQELKKLESDAKLYKSVGAVLVTQPQDEAISLVEKRLAYISQEIQRVDRIAEDLNNQIISYAKEIEKIQQNVAVNVR